MIERLDISGVHLKLDESLEKYTKKKIGQLDRFAPSQIRDSMHAEVKLKEGKAKDKKHCTCEVIMHLPRTTLTTSESTINMYAAVDIVEAKLIQQLRKYKDTHNPKFYRRLLSRFSER